MELADQLDLSSYLLKPVQRMTKYALLLQQMLKECRHTDPEHADLTVGPKMENLLTEKPEQQ